MGLSDASFTKVNRALNVREFMAIKNALNVCIAVAPTGIVLMLLKQLGIKIKNDQAAIHYLLPSNTAPPASPAGERAGFAAKPNNTRSRSLFSVSMNRTDS